MRLLSGLSALLVPGLLLAGCQAVEAPADSPLKSKVDVSIAEAAGTSEQRGDYGAAASYYRNVYERDPSNVEVAVGLSRTLRYIDRAREAEAVIARSLRTALKDKRLLAERGKVHLANGEVPQAVELLGQAAVGQDKDWDVHTALGVAFDRLGLYDQADRHYQLALTAAPDNAVVLNNYGLSLAQRGDLKGAVETLRRAASQVDATPKTRQNLALMYAMSGDLTRAEELVRRDLTPEAADENMALYRQLAANRRFADAGAVARAAAERSRLGDAPAAVVLAPLAPPPAVAVAPQPVPAPAAPAGGEAAKLPSEVVRPIPDATPAEVKVAEVKAAEADKPADGKPMAMAAPGAAASAAEKPAMAPGAPVPLTPQAAMPAATPAETTPAETTPAEAKPGAATPAAGKPPTIEMAAAARESSASPATPKPAAAPTAGGTPYKLQLASFRRQAQAEQARSQIRTQYKDLLGEMALEVSRIELGTRGEFYRVMTDALDSRAAAAALCNELRAHKADCLLVRVEE